MTDTGIGEYVVHGTMYKYTKLAPVDALRFGTQCAKVLGPLLLSFGKTTGPLSNAEMVEGLTQALALMDAGQLEGLLKVAYQHTYTPANECLGDDYIFNKWFQEHKSHLLAVGINSLARLMQDFFPSLSDITVPGFPSSQ